MSIGIRQTLENWHLIDKKKMRMGICNATREFKFQQKN